MKACQSEAKSIESRPQTAPVDQMKTIKPGPPKNTSAKKAPRRHKKIGTVVSTRRCVRCQVKPSSLKRSNRKNAPKDLFLCSYVSKLA
jgi:hypothetical protein